MKLLLVRLTSLGDVLHTLPALTDLQAFRPDVQIHWLLEPAYVPIVRLHPVVGGTIPYPLRSLRQKWWRLPGSLYRLRKYLREQRYDLALDSQGLFKSALLARLSGTEILGLDAGSAREPGATRFYGRKFPVPWGQPAITRNRQLFAQALGYPAPSGSPDYGLKGAVQDLREKVLPGMLLPDGQTPFILGFHATSRIWHTKEWPVSHWGVLARKAASAGYRLLLPSATPRERQRVEAIQREGGDSVVALPPLNLEELMLLIGHARAYLGMDTGLSYLASALGLPGVTLYGPTAREQFSMPGVRLVSLSSPESCAPCRSTRCPRILEESQSIPCQISLGPDLVWSAMESCLENQP